MNADAARRALDLAGLDEGERELLASLRRFASERLNEDLIEANRESRFPRAAWRACAEMGIQGLPFPAEYGGSDASVLLTSLAMEALGQGCADNGLLFSLNAQMWSVQLPIWQFGTPEQKQRWLPKLCSGEWIGAHGMSEPDSGSDAYAMRSTARREGEHYVLDGTKTFVTDGPVADLFVLFARVGAGKSFFGVTGFVVERDTPGLSVGKPIEKMGLRTSPMSEVVLENCRIPVGHRLGREGDGPKIFHHSMEWERACLLGTAVGAMSRLLDTCVAYARTRRQFGAPIAKFQAVANRLVAMRVRLETSRLLLHQVSRLKQQGGLDLSLEAALAKLHISESWVESCLDAIQVHGGYGYTTEYEIERELRDAVASRLYSGTSEIQHNIIAKQMGL